MWLNTEEPGQVTPSQEAIFTGYCSQSKHQPIGSEALPQTPPPGQADVYHESETSQPEGCVCVLALEIMKRPVPEDLRVREGLCGKSNSER